jgi:hypothetical protein
VDGALSSMKDTFVTKMIRADPFACQGMAGRSRLFVRHFRAITDRCLKSRAHGNAG